MAQDAKQSLPQSRKITVIALFSALALAINVSHLNIPAPFAPFLYYDIWEIPIVIAFIMFGWRAGIFVSLVNLVGLFLIQPGALPIGPLYNFAATVTMFIGIALGYKIINEKKEYSHLLVSSTVLGILTRTVAMVIINAIFLPIPPPIGFSIPMDALAPYLIAIAVFNATLALYTIPLAYSIVRAILPRYRFGLAFSFSLQKRVAPNIPSRADIPKQN